MRTRRAEEALKVGAGGQSLKGSNEDWGRRVVPFPDAGDAKWVVSVDGGIEPLWSHSGRELFYRSGRDDIVSVHVETQPTFSAGPASVLFSATEYLANNNRRQYDVTPDDRRFIMLRALGGGRELVLVQNFFEELRARAGG